MGVDISHLVLVALGDAGNQVVDERLDGSDGCDILAVAVVELDLNDVLLGMGEGDGDVAKILCELASGALDGHDARLDVDLDCWRRRCVSSLVRKVCRRTVQTGVCGEKTYHPRGP